MAKLVKSECGIRFRLREPGATAQTPIICYIEYNGKPVIKVPTGLRIKPALWLSDKEKPLSGIKGLKSAEAHIFNSRISGIRHLIETAYRDHILKFDEYPDKVKFKEHLLRILRGEPDNDVPEPKDPCFVNFMSSQILLAKAGGRVKISGRGKGSRFSDETIRDHEGTVNLIRRFLESLEKKTICFDEVNLDFYKQLQQYMFASKGYSLNYFGKVVKNIKSFMKEAQELGYHKNQSYNSNRFLKPQEETDAVYLNTDQLDKLLHLDLSKSKGLENARDLFLVGCWTGLRFSDFSELSPKDVISGNFIQVKTKKTSASVAIPVLPALKKIMSRYAGITENSLPHPISNQKLNAYIKEIGKKAGFDHFVEVTRPEAGGRKVISVPFFQLITTHTARRSFATNMYRVYRLPPVTIMKITGHKSEAVFFKYIRITPEENAQLILDAVMNHHKNLD